MASAPTAAAASSSRKRRAAALSVLSNASLTFGKLMVAIAGGSLGVLSEAVHSGVDLLAAGLAFLAIRAAAMPADDDHAYGHGKFENLSALAEGALILVAGIMVAFEAWRHLVAPQPTPEVGAGLVIMAISCVTNLLLSRYLHHVAKAEDSPALEADAHHLSTDVITGLGVFCGLILVRVTGIALFDGLTALAVAIWILTIGFQLVRATLEPLSDAAWPPEERAALEEILNSFEGQVVEWHDLRTRRAGADRHVDVHLTVPGEITARAAHDLAEGVEKAVKARFPGTTVLTHVDVAETGPNGEILVSD